MRRLRIRHLLLITNAFILLLAFLGLVFFRLWDGHLVRITEQRLIAESVLVAESLRHEIDRQPVRLPVKLTRPQSTLRLSYKIEPRVATTATSPLALTSPLAIAANQLDAFLARINRESSSSVRILRSDGCDVGKQRHCYTAFPEVTAALSGQYYAVARRASAPESGKIEVATALPLIGEKGTIGVVHMSRLSFSPFDVFWNLRWTVLLATLACFAFTIALTLFFSRVISRPVAALTRSAQIVSRGDDRQPFTPDGFAPAEVHELADALDVMTSELTKRAEYISGFAANASHELKTPLTGIRGAVELLREEWSTMDDTQRDRFLANIDSDAERTQRLLEGLLTLARIESSADEKEECALADVITKLCDNYGDRVHTNLSRAPETIQMGRGHLETALNNLLDNAIRHGGSEPIKVEAWRETERTLIRVSDRGRGISDRNLTRIFDRFFTTERDNGGTGLGLSLVKAIVEAHGGRVEVETGAGGTAFTLVI